MPRKNQSSFFSWEITKELNQNPEISVSGKMLLNLSCDGGKTGSFMVISPPAVLWIQKVSDEKFQPGIFLVQCHVKTVTGSPRLYWFWSTWELGLQAPAVCSHLPEVDHPIIIYWYSQMQRTTDTKWTKWACLGIKRPTVKLPLYRTLILLYWLIYFSWKAQKKTGVIKF